MDPWGLSASENQKNTNKFGSELKDIGKKTLAMLQDGAQWVWNNRKPLLEMGLGITMMYGGEGIKRSGQFFGITIAVGGSLGTAGLGSPAAVGTGITIGVSATTVGNAIQLTGAALMIEGSRNLKGNDDKKTSHGQTRYQEGRAGNSNRNVGDINKIKANGKHYIDTETGNHVYVDGNKVYIENHQDQDVTRFHNPKANTLARVQSGKWKPVE